MKVYKVSYPKSALGFTLLEIMIAVALVAILAAIAYPSYSKYVINSRMQAGIRVLENITIAQERHFLVKRGFSDSLADLGVIDVPQSVQTDFDPVSIITAAPAIDSTTKTTDIKESNQKSAWVAVLSPRSSSRLNKQLRLAINSNGEKWMETNKNCNSDWATRCCYNGNVLTSGLCPKTNTSNSPCKNMNWREWLISKPNRDDLSC